MQKMPSTFNAAAQIPQEMRADSEQGAQRYQNGDYGYDNGDGGAAEDGDGNMRDPKRWHTARACDTCHKKKIKCDREMPKCSCCKKYKTKCTFTLVRNKRAPPKGAKYIEGLENRLGQMESSLRLSGLLAEDDGFWDFGVLEKRLQERSQGAVRSNVASPQSQTSPATVGGKTVSSPSTSTPANQPVMSPKAGNTSTEDASTKEPKDKGHVDVLADQTCGLITNDAGETCYIGSSSGFSIFSQKGIHWVNTKTGDSSFQRMMSAAAEDGRKVDYWKPEVFDDLFSRRVFKALPGKQECISLLKDFFEDFNFIFPLFHEPTFMYLVEKHYSLDPCKGSGWWASLNVALAIAQRLRVMSNVVDSAEDEQAWGYLKNAMAVMTELTMRNTDLLSVQALLGMALFLQGTSNPQPSFFLVAAAIRLSHSIGLHKSGSGFDLNDVENEQRKRVFWIAYVLDKDICLRSGRPPAQDDDDTNVELPSEEPLDNVGSIPLTNPPPDGKKNMNLFRQLCTFARIQSRVYKSLYSVTAARQSDGELLNTIGDLDQTLEEWKESIPLDFRPEHEIKASNTPLVLRIVVLHFAYYNCLITIHRMNVHHSYRSSRLSDYAIQGPDARLLNPRVFMSSALCVNAARTSIGLIRYIPQGDYACVWLVLYHPVSSLVTLFANILQNPHDARARGDLKLMSSVINFLTVLERDTQESNGQFCRMLSVCAEFQRIAKVVLDKAERDLRGRGKRKQAEREREKDRMDNAITAELEQGKALEQIQVETQAAYCRPVQMSALRGSMSQPGSVAGGSPASWSGSPVGSNYNDPGEQHLQDSQLRQTPHQTSNVHRNPASFNLPLASNSTPYLNNHQDMNATSQPGDFAQANSPDNFNTPDLSDPLADFDMSNDYTCYGINNVNGPDSSFQQPFVSQDLWQMPMTLEWDWAEGLGMGIFTPGHRS